MASTQKPREWRGEIRHGMPMRLEAGQRAALAHLARGKSVAEAAKAAGLNRGTVYRWLKEDPAFQAAYNRWLDELEEGCRTRMLTMMLDAVDAVQKSLRAGDAKTAMQLLKGMGMIKPSGKRLLDEALLRQRAVLDRNAAVLEMASEDRKLHYDDQISRMMEEGVYEMAKEGSDTATFSRKGEDVKGVFRKTKVLPPQFGVGRVREFEG